MKSSTQRREFLLMVMCAAAGLVARAQSPESTAAGEDRAISFESWAKEMAEALSILQMDDSKLSEISVTEKINNIRNEESYVCVPSLLALALRGEVDLRTKWWSTRARSTRIAIVAWFSCTARRDHELFPPFESYAKRFRDPESTERLQEIELVNAREADFGRLFAERIAKNPTKNPLILDYKRNLERYLKK